jgi:membrane protein implicated in regulation of membrane protease activity
LAAADDLLVAGEQVKVELAIAGFLALKELIFGGVFLHTLDAILSTGLVGVALAGQYNLTVFRFKAEVVFLVILALKNLEFHKRSLVW